MRITIQILLALPLAGCASHYTEPPLADTHPASARAAASPLPERSGTLDPAHADPLTATPTPTHEHDAAPGHEHGQAASAPAAPADTALYTCPMHPEVVSKEPSRCPTCQMKLVPKEGGHK